MSEQSITVEDLVSAELIIADLPDELEAPRALLSKLVTDIKDAMDDLTEAPVTVFPASEDIEDAPEDGPVDGPVDPAASIGKQFAEAFTPSSSSHAVEIRLHKVHRA